MQFNFFGNKFEINITKRQEKNFNINKLYGKYNVRMSAFILSFILFSGLFIYYRNKTEYVIGTQAKHDVIAYKTVKYSKDILDKDLKEKILKNTKPEYDRKDEIADAQLKKFTNVLNNLSTVDLKDIGDVRKFIRDNKLNISSDDLISVGINGGNKYHIYLEDILTKIYEEGLTSTQDLTKILSKKQIILDDYEKELIKNFIEPNLIINEEETNSKIDSNIRALKNNTIVIKKGDFILKKGDEITEGKYEQLKQLGLVTGYDKTVSNIFKIIYTIMISIAFYIGGKKYLSKSVNSKGFYPSLICFNLVNFLYLLTISKSETLLYIIPFATVSIISSILTKDKLFSAILSTMTAILLAPNLEWFIAMNIIAIVSIYNTSKLTNRMELVKNGFIIGAMQGIFSIIYSVVYNYDLKILTVILSFSLLSGFFTGMICLGILPYFENAFSILTDIKLLETGDYSSPLLKRLLLEAPGTFYHSIMVGALAEQAAAAIGANPILARVGAYYHDIGKLKRPVYFVENQGGLPNLHDELKPSLSALLLTSHPKDGYILAKQYGLPQEVLDIIIEHHGTTMVQYFYYKAVETGENINETDFRYVGPRPSSKESAIVMLADTVEAAVRASNDKSKEGIENTIRYLIKYKIDDNQLNNCDIKLQDIEKIVQAFLKVLKAAYHERIQYPKIGRK